MKTRFYEDKSSTVKLDFSQQQARENWRISNDDVMGGVSTGSVNSSQDKVIFSGDISLENNGGFSAVFHKVAPMNENLNHIILDFEGDGHCYQMRLITKNQGQSIYYYHEFRTEKDERQKVTLNLADFQATFRGKKVMGAPKVVSQDIEEIGFLLTKKQAGNFALSLFSLSFIV